VVKLLSLCTFLLAFAVSLPADADSATKDLQLDEIIVTATLRSAPAIEVPASVTVLSGQTLRDAGRANFEDVLGLIPNLNWAGDTSPPCPCAPAVRCISR
jgi:outer membrane receptor protein involved in Fe transport